MNIQTFFSFFSISAFFLKAKTERETKKMNISDQGLYIAPSGGTSGMNMGQGVLSFGATYDPISGKQVTGGLRFDSKGITIGSTPDTKGLDMRNGTIQTTDYHSADTKEQHAIKGIRLDSKRQIHRSPLSSSWYQKGSADVLMKQMETLFENAQQKFGKYSLNSPKAIIAPHAGVVFSGTTAAAAYQVFDSDMSFEIKRVIVLSPNHKATAKAFRGVGMSKMNSFQTPFGETTLDLKTMNSWNQTMPELFAFRDDVHEREHAVEMQLIFLQYRLGLVFQMIPLIVGELSSSEIHQVAETLHPLLMDSSTLFVISTDWTHYGKNYHYDVFKHITNDPDTILDEIQQLDSKAIELVTSSISSSTSSPLSRFQEWLKLTRDTICGEWPLQVWMALIQMHEEMASSTNKSLGWAHLTAYDTSYAHSSSVSSSSVSLLSMEDFSNVSYASLVYGHVDRRQERKLGLDFSDQQSNLWTPFEKQMMLDSVKNVIEHTVGLNSKSIEPHLFYDLCPIASPVLQQKLGLFVTIYKNQHLRGCIGRIQADNVPIYQSIVDETIATAYSDPRFKPVIQPELQDLTYEITLLSPLRPIGNYKTDIQVGKHGVWLQNGFYRAVFLPQVPVEQGRNWTLIEYLNELARKAGMPPRSGINLSGTTLTDQEEFDFTTTQFSVFEGFTIK